MPLFHIHENKQAARIRPGGFKLEKDLQTLVEQNLETIFGVRFVASEFVVHGEQPGRIDTLGLDSEGAPTIIEYKRDQNQSVINQGLYYLNWLLDHRGGFVVTARDALGHDVEINWGHPRLIIIAQSYAKWDTYAVNRMGEGIELWEYVRYGDDLLYLNQVYGQQRAAPAKPAASDDSPAPEPDYTLDFHQEGKSKQVRELFQRLREGILSLGIDEGEIIETPNKLYISYRHGKNFCEVQLMAKGLKLHLDLLVSELNDLRGIARDVSNVGHWGTGDTEVRLDSLADLEYVLDLVAQSYRMTL